LDERVAGDVAGVQTDYAVAGEDGADVNTAPPVVVDAQKDEDHRPRTTVKQIEREKASDAVNAGSGHGDDVVGERQSPGVDESGRQIEVAVQRRAPAGALESAIAQAEAGAAGLDGPVHFQLFPRTRRPMPTLPPSKIAE